MSIVFTTCFHTGLRAEDVCPLPDDNFIRLVYDENNELKSLDTSFATLISEDGTLRVTLISAIHIGEKKYYNELNKRFTNYEVVLFEMVGDNNPRPVKGSESNNLVGSLQRTLGNALQLKFQVGSINYHAENFVHADMSSDEFKNAMQQRGDSLLSWFLRSIQHDLEQPEAESKYGNVTLLGILLAKNRTQLLRRMCAEKISDLKSARDVIEGQNGSALVSDRNTKALEVLHEQVDAGKKNIAIFYGAAHMPDFSERLIRDWGLKLECIDWIQCWKLD